METTAWQRARASLACDGLAVSLGTVRPHFVAGISTGAAIVWQNLKT